MGQRVRVFPSHEQWVCVFAFNASVNANRRYEKLWRLMHGMVGLTLWHASRCRNIMSRMWNICGMRECLRKCVPKLLI